MKYVLLVLFSSSLIMQANAQRIRAGATVGMDASRMALNDAAGTPLTYINKPTGGVFIETMVAKSLGIQAEANYSSQGVGGIAVGTTLSFKFNYVTIPLLLKLYGSRNFSLLAGAQLGILLDAKYIYNGVTTDYKDKLTSTDHYALLGAEYRFDNGVFAGARYHTGMTNIETEGLFRMHHRYFSFRIGYSFPIKK